MDVVDILGIAGFVIAAFLAYLQIRDYHRRLHLLITHLDCQPADNETSLVLIRLAFVNPSPQGKTVYDIDVESRVTGIPLIELNQEVEASLQSVTYSIPNVSRQVPFAETLQFPLDILPNQSLSKWLAIAVSYQGIPPVVGTSIRIRATHPVGKDRWKLNGWGKGHYLGVKKKILAERSVTLFPAKQTSKTIDIYYNPQI